MRRAHLSNNSIISKNVCAFNSIALAHVRFEFFVFQHFHLFIFIQQISMAVDTIPLILVQIHNVNELIRILVFGCDQKTALSFIVITTIIMARVTEKMLSIWKNRQNQILSSIGTGSHFMLNLIENE